MNWDGLTPNSFWYDSHRLLFNKDSRLMAELPDEYIQMVVTSPPYWGLRKYAGLPDLVWGGKEDCNHQWIIKKHMHNWERKQSPMKGISREASASATGYQYTNFCSLCGAWKGQLGLEPTPEMYTQHTIEILREIKRVLRKDGVVFLNIGDSYLGSNCGYGDYRGNKSSISIPEIYGSVKKPQAKIGKPKDMALIPFRLAIALQEDKWWVRSVIIWNKPNPMPESVTDRPTESHEYILMLTKSARYYWDAEAVREPIAYPEPRWGKNPKYDEQQGGLSNYNGGEHTGRNLRSVWTFSTQSYKEAHFATYPEKLVEICVKAATPEVGCCSKCGKPWVRITEVSYKQHRQQGKWEDRLQNADGYARNPAMSKYGVATKVSQTLGWKPQCKCETDKVPSIVLDPFAGSGTTLKVAAELNRRAIGYELSEEYCDLTVERNKQGVMV